MFLAKKTKCQRITFQNHERGLLSVLSLAARTVMQNSIKHLLLCVAEANEGSGLLNDR